MLSKLIATPTGRYKWTGLSRKPILTFHTPIDYLDGKYIGEAYFSNKAKCYLPHGVGTFRRSNGETVKISWDEHLGYEGKWTQGRPNGLGVYTPAGSKRLIHLSWYDGICYPLGNSPDEIPDFPETIMEFVDMRRNSPRELPATVRIDWREEQPVKQAMPALPSPTRTNSPRASESATSTPRSSSIQFFDEEDKSMLPPSLTYTFPPEC